MSAPGPYSNGPPFQSDYSRSNGGNWDRPQRGRGGHQQGRYGGMRDHNSDRSRPYDSQNKSFSDQSRHGGQRNYKRHPDGPAPIHRYIKPSFFENPWHSLEQIAGIPAPIVPIPQTAPTASIPIASPSIQPESDVNPPVGSSSARLGLSLPPPKQKMSTSSVSSFLSKLPPPKATPSATEGIF